MKKFSILAVVILIVILTTCLVGCSYGDPIEFTKENLVLEGSTDTRERNEKAEKIDGGGHRRRADGHFLRRCRCARPGQTVSSAALRGLQQIGGRH